MLLAFDSMELFEQSLGQNLLAILIGYLIGSIPFAYLFAKWRSGVDLRKEGSGNIGTLNSYEVTGSRTVGVLTLFADVFKGWLPVFLAVRYWSPAAAVVLAIGLVLGHCYPIWLKFKGGRGLATAAGTTFAVNLLLLILWCVGYGVGLIFRRQVHIDATIATLFTAGALLVLPSWAVEAVNLLNISGEAVRYGAWAMLFVILTRHVQPFMQAVRTRTA